MIPGLKITGLKGFIRTDDGAAHVLDDVGLALEGGRILGVGRERRGGAAGLVIADEPTTALDVTTQHEILLLLRELADEMTLSLLFVTHDLGVVAELCDDVCVIYAGQTVEAGRVDAVLRAPSHPYTRALLACHPERATSFLGIPGTVPSPLRMPPGCRFAPRCPLVEAVCGDALP